MSDGRPVDALLVLLDLLSVSLTSQSSLFAEFFEFLDVLAFLLRSASFSLTRIRPPV